MIFFPQGYEERTYPAKKWVCSKEESDDGTQIMEHLFWRLFRYIDGENVQGESSCIFLLAY